MPSQQIPTDMQELSPLAIIVAMTEDRVIGMAGGLPWHLADDLQLFKRLTTGGTVIMGRKTQGSIGHPLPDRHNIVLSRTLEVLPGAQVCHDFTAGLKAAARHGKPIFVIGGSGVYSKALPFASELHISWIKGRYPGDVHFPAIDLAHWDVLEKQDHPEFLYVHYRRRGI